jgi:hypothetical protein
MFSAPKGGNAAGGGILKRQKLPITWTEDRIDLGTVCVLTNGKLKGQ